MRSCCPAVDTPFPGRQALVSCRHRRLSDQSLFESAVEVCPTSAKMLSTVGRQQTRQNMTYALELFE